MVTTSTDGMNSKKLTLPTPCQRDIDPPKKQEVVTPDGEISPPTPSSANAVLYEDNNSIDDDKPHVKQVKPQEIPAGLIGADEDLLADFEEDTDEIQLLQCRIKNLPDLRLERFQNVKRICLRQNQISSVVLPSSLGQTLQELDLYDNLISHCKGFDDFTELKSLDLSFNKIRHIKRLNHMHKLRDLYLVQNKISTIEGLDGLVNLRMLELGANKIRQIENLDTLTSLEELWLAKNRITELKNLNPLMNLTLLSIQSNRLTSLTGLECLVNLEALHVSDNALTRISGLDANIKLNMLDIANNPIEHLENLAHLTSLECLWANGCKLTSFSELEAQLSHLPLLNEVYFEGNPLHLAQPTLYRNKTSLALPQVRKIDAMCLRV